MKILYLIFTIISLLGLNSCARRFAADELTNNTVAAHYNLQLGMAYLQRGQVTLAKQKLTLALQQAPQWPPVYDAMAYFWEYSGDPSLAVSYYQKALVLSPHDPRAHNNYGTFLCRHDQEKLAIREFLRAAQNPRYLHAATAYANAGFCALAYGDKSAANGYLRTALQRDRRLKNVKEALKTLGKRGKL